MEKGEGRKCKEEKNERIIGERGEKFNKVRIRSRGRNLEEEEEGRRIKGEGKRLRRSG